MPIKRRSTQKSQKTRRNVGLQSWQPAFESRWNSHTIKSRVQRLGSYRQSTLDTERMGLASSSTFSQTLICMKRLILAIGLVIVLAAGWAVVRRKIPSTIDYRGEKIKLTKLYFSYESYKDDPGNIDASENQRVARLVSEAPIANSFRSRKDAVEAVFAIKFPGYGAGGFGDSIRTREGSLNGLCVEIPRTDKSRYFIFRIVGGSYVLVDDFVAPDELLLQTFREDNGSILYIDNMGQTKLIHPITKS